MIPIYLDPGRARVALIGRGALAVRRLEWLREAGAAPDVWSDQPGEDLINAAQDALIRRLPTREEARRYNALWIADLPHETARELAEAAAGGSVLVNVEDVVALCAFHTPAVARRGRLTLAVGTGGASPAVARAARERLEEAFPVQWGRALEEIAEARAALRFEGAGAERLIADARARLAAHGIG